MKEPSDPEKRDYEIKINKLLSTTEQLREAIYAKMMAITSGVFDASAPVAVTTHTLLSEYIDANPLPDNASWQEKIIRVMAIYMNSEMMLDIERRHGTYLGEKPQG